MVDVVVGAIVVDGAIVVVGAIVDDGVLAAISSVNLNFICLSSIVVVVVFGTPINVHGIFSFHVNVEVSFMSSV